MPLSKRELGWFLFWIAAASLTSGLFLFQIPGFHYDEAWIAQLGSKIAFEHGFWPVFGMNHYTVPVMSYILAMGFRLAGHPSMEIARSLYFAMNLASFGLLYLWALTRTGQRNAGAASIFALLWVTLPLSVFNQRIFLEVTTGYALFGAIALWGMSEAFQKNNVKWLVLGIVGVMLGAASHILFLGAVWAAIWACWKECPDRFENRTVKWAVTWTLAPMIVPLTAAFFSPIGGGERVKIAVVASVTFLVLAAVWKGWWKLSVSQTLLKLSTWLLSLLSVAGLFFFLLFEISGVWPLSQTTGEVHSWAAIPGFAIAGILLFAIFQKGNLSRGFLFFRSLWLVICALSVISIYKPSSARYWELALLAFMITGAWALSSVKLNRKPLISGLIAASFLNVVVLGQAYFGSWLNHGATADSYHWLWVHDSSLDYRPVVRAYQWLRASKDFCRDDLTDVDEGRNAFVLQVYRDFARSQGLEKRCEAGHMATRYLIGAKDGIPNVPSMGDVQVTQVTSMTGAH